MNCPNCGTRNAKDAAYCAKCGFRLPTAAGRGAGIAYRRADVAEPAGGGGQGLLAFGAVLLAGLLFAVGAVALLTGGGPAPTGTRVAGVDDPSSSLPPFVQPTPDATPTPTLEITPIPTSPFQTPTPLTTPGIETPLVTPTPITTVAPGTPTPTPTATPVRTPRPPTPTPTATPAAIDCANVTGDVQTKFLGFGNASTFGPIGRSWCIQDVTFHPFIESDPNNSATGEPGRTRLFVNTRRIASDTCEASDCNDETITIPPARKLAIAGSTLRYDFQCMDNTNTPDDECTDADQGGSVIEIHYIIVRST